MSAPSDVQTFDHVADLLAAFVNGTLARSEREQVMSHLQRCPGCAADLRAWQAIREATRASVVPSPVVPATILDGVWAALDDHASSPHPTPEQPIPEETMSTVASFPLPSTPVSPATPAWPSWRPPDRAWRRTLPALLAVAAVLALVLAGTIGPGRSALSGLGSVLPWQQGIPPDVPMFRVDPARTGVMPGPGPDGKPEVLWQIKTGGPMQASPALVNGVLYAGSLDGYFYAFDAATGEERWRFDTGGSDAPHPTVADGLVFVGDSNPGQGDGHGNVIVLDAATGEERWRLPDAQGSTPLVVDGTLYVGIRDGFLVALDAADGTEQWRAATGMISRGVTMADGVIYAPGKDGAIYALDAATGEERWRFAIGARLQAVAVGGGVVYVPGGDGSLYALDAAKGTGLWRFAVDDPSVWAPVLVDETVFVSGANSRLYAVDATNGEERWHVDVEGAIVTPAVVSGGVIYLGTDTGSLYALGEPTEDAPVVLPADSGNAGLTGPAEFLWQAANGTEPIDQVGGMAVAPNGDLWVVETNTDRILIYSPDGAFRETWGTPGPSDGEFNFVLENFGGGYGDIGFDQDGNIYVLDSGNFRVQKFDRTRRFVSAWGTEGSGDGQFIAPVTMTVDPHGNVYVADDGRGDIQQFASDGTYLATIASRGPAEGQTECIPAFGVDAAGTIYVPDCWRHEIQTFAPDGTFRAAWGSEGRQNGQFRFPSEVAIDAAGRIFVTDSGNNRVQVFDAEGNFITAWGSFGSGDGEFNGTGSLVLDGAGNIYVGDGNGRIQKFRLLPPLAP